MTRALLLLCATFLAGCLFETNQRVAGGAEDFPNTITLGAALSEDVGGQADWDQFSNIPAVLPTFKGVDTLALAPGASAEAKTGASPAGAEDFPQGLAKGSAKAAKPDTTWNFSDTATLGVVYRYISQELFLPPKLRRDTTTFRYDSAFKSGIPGQELILESRGHEALKNGNRLQTYLYRNRDSAGALDYGVFFLKTFGADGYYRNSLLIATGGPDGDIFTKADNVPVYYAFAKTDDNGGGKVDTVDAFDIADADSDGVLWGKNDSGLVDFRQKKTNPEGRPAVRTIVQKTRALLFKDEAKTYPVSFTEIRTDKDGKKVVFSVKGTRPDSAFGAGDTVFVNVKTTPGPGLGRFEERNVRFVILLSATPKRFQDNLLLSFMLETRWRPGAWKKGGLIYTRVRFKPDQPVLSAHLTDAAALDVDVAFEDGSTGSATGRLEGDHIVVELTEKPANGKTRRFQIEWNLAGVVTFFKKL